VLPLWALLFAVAAPSLPLLLLGAPAVRADEEQPDGQHADEQRVDEDLRDEGRADAPLEASSESGPVRALVRLAPRAPAIGDPLVLELEVRAEPGVELLMPEFGDALDRFTIVDFTRSESADDAGATLSRQRYTLAPARSGAQLIPPLLVEFVDRREGRAPAPEGADAYELFTSALEFEVASALPEGAPAELRAPLGALGPRVSPGRAWLLGGLFALLAAAAAAFFGARAWSAWRTRALRRSAHEVATAELDALLRAPRPGAGEMDAFFVQLSGIVRRYIENRFGLRSPELTTEEFMAELASSPDLVRSQQRLLQEFLTRADLVKFAHLLPDAAGVERSLESARSFLEATREGSRA
jgi:HAMP domain-containing protein